MRLTREQVAAVDDLLDHWLDEGDAALEDEARHRDQTTWDKPGYGSSVHTQICKQTMQEIIGTAPEKRCGCGRCGR